MAMYTDAELKAMSIERRNAVLDLMEKICDEPDYELQYEARLEASRPAWA